MQSIERWPATTNRQTNVSVSKLGDWKEDWFANESTKKLPKNWIVEIYKKNLNLNHSLTFFSYCIRNGVEIDFLSLIPVNKPFSSSVVIRRPKWSSTKMVFNKFNRDWVLSKQTQWISQQSRSARTARKHIESLMKMRMTFKRMMNASNGNGWLESHCNLGKDENEIDNKKSFVTGCKAWKINGSLSISPN